MRKDYCTLSPDLTHGLCCKQHDIEYAFQLPKSKSDIDLFKCIKNKSGFFLASIYYIVVSTFGWYWYLKAKREAKRNVT